MATLLEIGLINAAVATALALVAAVVGRLGHRPALTHALWLLVLLKLVTPPLWVVHLPWPAAPEPEAVHVPDTLPGPTPDEPPAVRAPARVAEPDVSSAPDGAPSESVVDVEAPATAPAPADVPQPIPPPPAQAGAAPAATLAFPWQTWAVAAWLAGALGWWALAAVRLRRFRHSLHHARPAPDDVRAQATRLAARLGLRRCPRVEMLPASVSPMLWAVAGAPRLLLPAALWERLSGAQQETLLVHELAHLRRGDHWVRRLELLVLGLYWWHPVVWWARDAIQVAEEPCCDAFVVRTLPDRAADYAAALLETVMFLSPPRTALPVGASGAGSARLLRRRLLMILHARTARPLPWYTRAALLGCAAVLLPLLPARAQSVTPPAIAPAAGSSTTAETTASAPPAAGETTAPVAASGGTTVYGGAPAGAARPEDVDDLKDEVELLLARLAGKRAELKEAHALLARTRRELDRIEKLNRQGAVPEGEIDRARTDVAVYEARIAGKAAQMQELEVQLRQAKRRLARATGARTTSTGIMLRSVPPAAQTSTYSAGPAARTTTAPALSRSTVAESTPAAGDTRPALTGRLTTAARDQEQRLRDVERKLDTLLREINALRRELHQQRQEGAPRGAPRSVPEEGEPARR
jgi:beta-lactamase regulating signal transducer with metallopeptidase domain